LGFSYTTYKHICVSDYCFPSCGWYQWYWSFDTIGEGLKWLKGLIKTEIRKEFKANAVLKNGGIQQQHGYLCNISHRHMSVKGSMLVVFMLVLRASGRVISLSIGRITLRWQSMNLNMDFWICQN